MPLTKEQKAEILETLKEDMGSAKAVVFADFQGVNVKDFQVLRRKLREAGVKFSVVKKTLIKLAAEKHGFKDIPEEVLEGSVGVALSMEDEVAAAKILHNFSKENGNLKLRGSFFEGKILGVKETKVLALIPGKDELIGKFVFLIKSPISGFHGVLNNTISGFVRVLDAVREKQEQAA